MSNTRALGLQNNRRKGLGCSWVIEQFDSRPRPKLQRSSESCFFFSVVAKSMKRILESATQTLVAAGNRGGQPTVAACVTRTNARQRLTFSTNEHDVSAAARAALHAAAAEELRAPTRIAQNIRRFSPWLCANFCTNFRNPSQQQQQQHRRRCRSRSLAQAHSDRATLVAESWFVNESNQPTTTTTNLVNRRINVQYHY